MLTTRYEGVFKPESSFVFVTNCWFICPEIFSIKIQWKTHSIKLLRKWQRKSNPSMFGEVIHLCLARWQENDAFTLPVKINQTEHKKTNTGEIRPRWFSVVLFLPFNSVGPVSNSTSNECLAFFVMQVARHTRPARQDTQGLKATSRYGLQSLFPESVATYS